MGRKAGMSTTDKIVCLLHFMAAAAKAKAKAAADGTSSHN